MQTVLLKQWMINKSSEMMLLALRRHKIKYRKINLGKSVYLGGGGKAENFIPVETLRIFFLLSLETMPCLSLALRSAQGFQFGE